MVVHVDRGPISVSFCEMFATLSFEPSSRNLTERVKNILLKPPKSMEELSQALLSCFTCKIDIDDQRKKFELSTKKQSWNTLKAVRSHEDMRELDQFRSSLNTLINDFTAQCGRELGFADVSWRICGTTGYNSDVDITATTPTQNIEELVFYKVIRDCIHYAVLGGLSGFQLDTECYIPHIAEFDFSQYLAKPHSHLSFITGEKAAVVLQRYQSLKNTQLYARSRDEDLASITDADEQESMRLLHVQVEQLMAHLEGISPCQRISILTRLACKSTALHDQIIEASRAQNVELLDQLHLKLHRLLLTIAALQVEGTFSVAEGKATLLQAGGQVYDGVVKQRKNSLTSFYERRPDDLLANHPQFRRKASPPLIGTLSNSEELARCILKEESQKVLQPSFEPSTFQTLLIAAYEEAQQLEAAIYPNMDAIGAGKYALRVTKHLLQALKLCENAPQKLIRLARKLEQTAITLEKCKRKQALSSNIATMMLSDVILASLAKRGSADLTRVHTVVSQMFLACDESKFTDKEHVDFLKKTLKGAKDLFVDVEKPEILNILQAHAGYNFPHLAQIHDEAVTLTLQDLNVKEFFTEIGTLGRDVRNFARNNGLLPISTAEMAIFYDFAEVLKEVSPPFGGY